MYLHTYVYQTCILVHCTQLPVSGTLLVSESVKSAVPFVLTAPETERLHPPR